MDELNTFDKINLAACAAKRAKANFMNEARFTGEYATVLAWKAHKVIQTSLRGNTWGYVTKA